MQPATDSSSSAHWSTQPTLIMSESIDLVSLLPKNSKRKRSERLNVFELFRTSSSKDDMKSMGADVDWLDQKKRMMNNKKTNVAVSIATPPTNKVIAKFRSMGATTEDPLLRVMTKNVTNSDADRAHNRLLLPKKIVGESRLLEGLTEDERDLVGKEEENEKGPKPKGLQVVMVDEEGRNYDVVLKFLISNNAYRIIGKDYVDFVAKNNLTPVLDTVHLCLFRVEDGRGQLKLKLGVVKTKDAEEEAMLPAAPVHEDSEEVLRQPDIREDKRPLFEDEEEEKVQRLPDIGKGKTPFLEEVPRLGSNREGMRPVLEYDLNLPPSEESIA